MLESGASQTNSEMSDAANQAAKAIAEADFLLVASGAGLSADSGLLTFATVSEHLSAVLGEGIKYDQAASSDMMARNPALFYGFWFHSARNYANAQPHEGYHILRKWREQKERRLAEHEPVPDRNYALALSPVFTMTSNVDLFLKRSEVPTPGALAQIHGSMEKWQCGGVPSGSKFPLFTKGRCCDDMFDPPSDEGMNYDTMRFSGSAPSCPRCHEGWLRPHVYLFGDGNRFVNKEEETGEQAYRNWCQEIQAKLKANTHLRLTIVEIGCGLRVPNIRKRCEELFAACPSEQAELVRINPEVTQEQFAAQPTVFVKARALEGLKEINAIMLTY